ncbi:MAG: tyrosine-type recombinase/integrase [Candidatus Eremiobacterota bacterium]
MVEYYSSHGPFFTEYIEFKRSLGYRYKCEYVFAVFDRFLLENNVTDIGLTRKVFEQWGQKRPNESDINRYKRVNDIRNFSIYLNGIGYPSYVPRQIYQKKTTFTPYIFTKEEIDRFFQACDSLRFTKHSMTTHIYPAVFRLIYGCGLRANEALSIKCGDINLENKYVIIRNTKNGEERMLPISDSLTETLWLYKNFYRNAAKEKDFFFVNLNGDRCSSDSMYAWFRRILRIAGISHGGRGYGPRVHDMRHSFSVHSLATMSDRGLDLYYCLPLLSKYLGHKSLEATDKYVRLTEDMYPGIMNEMNQVCAYVFPEVARL